MVAFNGSFKKAKYGSRIVIDAAVSKLSKHSTFSRKNVERKYNSAIKGIDLLRVFTGFNDVSNGENRVGGGGRVLVVV